MNSETSGDLRLAAFVDHLDRLGSDLDLWPADDAEAARRLLTESAAAREALAAAGNLTATVNDLPQISAPAGTLNRIAQRPEPDAWEKLSAWFAGALWRPLLAGSMPLIAGFLLGFTLAPNTSDTMADQMSLVTLSTSIDATGSEELDYDL